MGSPPETLTTFGDRNRAAQPADTAPFLFVALACDQPDAGTLRCALAGADEVVLGRGPELEASRQVADDVTTVRVTAADPRMSTEHARLERTLGRWVVLDRSKNGTFVNGDAIDRHVLADGDVIECGHTLFLFRAAQLWRAGEPTIVRARELDPAPAGWRTLVPGFAAELDRLRQVAASPVPVLIAGETGTGKELIARGLHALSRRAGRFIAVNCGALPETLLPSELFGHRKGAFSGAVQDRAGLVRDAHGGTLLLDEIGDLPAAVQAVLLRVLQEREVVPLGSTTPVPVDVRIVAASHRDLEALVAAGEFREDLLARLAGFRFQLPALRERREDLGILIGDLLGAHGSGRVSALTVDAGRALLGHHWPRNVRELEQCLSAAIALAGSGPIGLQHLPGALVDSPAEADLSDEERALRTALVDALREHGGNVTAAAKSLGKARQQVQRWMKRYAIRTTTTGRHRSEPDPE